MRIRCVVKPRAVFKMSVVHSELLCTVIKHFNKRFIATRKVFAESRAGVVGAVNRRCFEQIVNCHLLALFQPKLRAAL